MVKSLPAFTSGFGISSSVTVSERVSIQGEISSANNVNVTVPFSPTPGVYVGVMVPCPAVIDPVPFHSQRMFSTLAILAPLLNVYGLPSQATILVPA